MCKKCSWWYDTLIGKRKQKITQDNENAYIKWYNKKLCECLDFCENLKLSAYFYASWFSVGIVMCNFVWHTRMNSAWYRPSCRVTREILINAIIFVHLGFEFFPITTLKSAFFGFSFHLSVSPLVSCGSSCWEWLASCCSCNRGEPLTHHSSPNHSRSTETMYPHTWHKR